MAITFDPPAWLPGGHLQTIVPAVWARQSLKIRGDWTRQRWTTPDADFIDVDRLSATIENASYQPPLLVLFHGLEGSSGSHYAKSFAEWAKQHGVDYAIPHFRGCSGELNIAARAYHSGDHEEVHWILKRFKAEAKERSIVAVGVSLGGNALMRWAGEQGNQANKLVDAIASISSPLDLAASGHAMGAGLNKQIYTRMFLRTMKPKALQKLDQHPGLFDATELQRASDLYSFDNVFTAPLHGFRNTEDYWRRASAKPHLKSVRVPALLLNARNDPFVPSSSLPSASDIWKDSVELWQPERGGHVGFPAAEKDGTWRMSIDPLPAAVGGWLLDHVQDTRQRTEHQRHG